MTNIEGTLYLLGYVEIGAKEEEEEELGQGPKKVSNKRRRAEMGPLCVDEGGRCRLRPVVRRHLEQRQRGV